MSASDELLSFIREYSTRSNAQLHQDLWVLWTTAQRRGGYFVEVGAADGLYLSNTLLLERDFGWTGIVVEALPAWHAQLAANRRCRIDRRCVAGSSGKSVSLVTSTDRPDLTASAAVAFDDMHAATRRTFTETVAVPTVSLNDLLAEHVAPDVIDYLSIDTEGTELEILQHFDFKHYTVRLLTVEHNFHSDKRHMIAEILLSNGFKRCFEELSQWDDWYVSNA